jgi:hypothetical protein
MNARRSPRLHTGSKESNHATKRRKITKAHGNKTNSTTTKTASSLTSKEALQNVAKFISDVDDAVEMAGSPALGAKADAAAAEDATAYAAVGEGRPTVAAAPAASPALSVAAAPAVSTALSPPRDNGEPPTDVTSPPPTATSTFKSNEDEEKNIKRNCICCYDPEIKKFNFSNGFVENNDIIFQHAADPSAFDYEKAYPGYLPVKKYPAENERIRASFISEVENHSKFVFEVAHYFSFIQIETLQILCKSDTDHVFRRALNERLAVMIYLVKKYTTIDKLEVESVIQETSNESLVVKGQLHLTSFGKRLNASNELRWDDLYGRCEKENKTNRRFGPFLSTKYTMKKEVNEDDFFKMYLTIGSGNYGKNSYRDKKETLLNGELFENNDGSKGTNELGKKQEDDRSADVGKEKFDMIDPRKVKEHAVRIVKEMLTGFTEATNEHTKDNELRGNFVMVHKSMICKMSHFMKTFGDASTELGFMNNFTNDSERDIYSTEVDNFVARFAWMVLQHIVSFSNMVDSNSYLETIKKQQQKSLEKKNSKRQRENKKKRHVQEYKGPRLFQERDVYFEFQKYQNLYRDWQKIEGHCPTDSFYLVVGDILQVTCTSPSRENKFNLCIANFDFPVNFADTYPIVFENLDNQVETEMTNISNLLDRFRIEVFLDEKDPRYLHALKSLSSEPLHALKSSSSEPDESNLPQYLQYPIKIKKTEDGVVLIGYLRDFCLLKIRSDKPTSV